MRDSVYLCCGNKTGVRNPGEWTGVDINEPCDVRMDVLQIKSLRHVRRIFATPPCNSFTDLPWRPATNRDRELLVHCLKLCLDAREDWLLECNRWAQRFIGRAFCHRGGHYFWGTVNVPEFEHRKMSTSGTNPLKRAALPVVW